MHCEEIEIPVPWGYIAAKCWGDKQNEPVICVHGILDNAGSFDHLIPYLPKHYRYVCIDLPGHGRSSHFAGTLPLHSIDFLLVYKLLVIHFKRTSYLWVTHSYGGQIGIIFAQLYPQHVRKLIMLDTVYLYTPSPAQFRPYLVDRYNYNVEMVAKMAQRSAPSYTYTEALNKMMTSRLTGNISQKSAENILKRNLKRSEYDNNKFYFTTDQRLKAVFNPLNSFEYVMNTLKKHPIKCPVLLILGRESTSQLKYMRELIAFYAENQYFTITYVDGAHDVHNDQPELVAPHIQNFFNKIHSKL